MGKDEKMRAACKGGAPETSGGLDQSALVLIDMFDRCELIFEVS